MMRIARIVVAAAIACSCLPQPLAAQAAATARLAPDAQAQWVAFDLTPGNQIRFRMRINGRPAAAILDTGVSYTVASTAYAAAIGLRPEVSGRAQAIGGSVALSWAGVESLTLGGLTRTGGRIAVAELKAIATGSAEPAEVLVGADILAGHALDIDYDARRFRLLPSGRMPFPGTSVPLGLSPLSGIFVGELTIGARRLRPVIVDTGDGGAITLSQASWAATGLSDTRLTSAFAFGLGGPVESDLTMLPLVKVGPLVARNIEVHIERGGGFSAQTGTAGRIGSGFLQRYRVLLDPKAKRMILRPGRTIDAVPVRSTSGLLVGLENDTLRVLHVMRNSPAAATGWKAGDRICRVDGAAIPPDYVTSPLSTWPAGTPGRTVKLELCDKGGVRSLTLADFY